jgi:DNA polymerase (family 10)
MDYPDKVLERLDLVIGSIHQGFKKDATKRMCAALAHPLVHLIAHPTGRIIGRREGYEIDLEHVIECAAKHRKILEINAFYGRLDLNDVWARRAMQAGVRLAINTDAHALGDLDWMRYGVITARRAWLAKVDVVNCLSYARLVKLLKAIRTGEA